MVFNCEKCTASYPVRKSLLNHIRFKHGDSEQFTCQHCVYATTKRENLKQHVRSQHEKIKEICGTCGKSFSDKPNLNKHVRNFHQEKVQGTKRKAAETMPNPLKKKKTEALKELKCGVCQKEFKELKNLNKHMKNVHGEKSLKCENCNYTTNDAPSMQRHAGSCKQAKEKVCSKRRRSAFL